VLIVTTVSAAVTFMIGLIASPVMEWSSRLPQLGGMLKDKQHVFDRPLALLAGIAEHARRGRQR
jgi:hypothetical protein